jgi:hypothetical protein
MLRRAPFLIAAAALAVPAAARADTTAAPGARTSSAPVATADPTPPPVPAPAPDPTPVPTPVPPLRPRPTGSTLRLSFVHPLRAGARAFGIAGRPVEVRATLSRYVAGQKVLFRAYRAGRRVLYARGRLRRAGPHAVAQVRFATGRAGGVKFTAVHPGTSRQRRLWAHARWLHFWSPDVGFGARGPVVELIQRRLVALRYHAFRTGVLDAATGRALLAFRKVNRLPRAEVLGRYVLGRLLHRRGAFRARYPFHRRHVEADLSRQVLAFVNPRGRVYAVLPISSGKPSTPTVRGSFFFYAKAPGVNSEGMYDSNYFIRGYAVHGYPSVPSYAASHGCLRMFNADAPFAFRWIRLGERIDVYR